MAKLEDVMREAAAEGLYVAVEIIPADADNEHPRTLFKVCRDQDIRSGLLTVNQASAWVAGYAAGAAQVVAIVQNAKS